MKVIFARSGYSPTGGAERYLCRLVQGLKDRKIETLLFNDGAWPEENWPGDQIVTISADSPKEFAKGVNATRKDFSDALLFSFDRIPGADVFRVGDGIHTDYLQRLSANEGFLSSWFRKTRRFHRDICALEQELFTRSERLHVICNSQMVARGLQEYFSFPETRISTIYNGFTPEDWTGDERNEFRQTIRQQFNIPSDAPVILFVGTGWKRKGVEELVSAFKKLSHPEAHLILVGKGRLKQRGSEQIHLAGPVMDPRPYYLAADLFALPTLYDPFSNACLEAAAYGLPVLTTNGNGFSEALSSFPRAGEVVSAPDWPDALGRWLLAGTRNEASAVLPQLVSAHSIDSNVTQTLDLLVQLAAEKK